MLKKITNSFLLLILIASFNLSYSRDHKPIKVKALDGSEAGKVNTHSKSSDNTITDYKPLVTSSYIVYYYSFGLSSYYDLQSNGSPNEIWQNALSPDNVHAAAMVLPTFGGTRYVNYFLSTDRGMSWANLGNVANAQSGFPSIDGFTDNGVAAVSMQTTAGGVTPATTQIFVDEGAGFGVFDRLNPGVNASSSQMIWGRLITTGTSVNPVKIVNVSSGVGGINLSSTVTCTNTVPPGSFGSWINYGGSSTEQYSLALGQDGRIGIAYIAEVVQSEPTIAFGQGSVLFKESTNNGLTWGSPVIIFNANSRLDKRKAFRGINMIYLQNSPCVTYELDVITDAGLFPTSPSYIMYWSPAVNDGISIQISGPNNVPFYPNTGPSASYGVYTSLCRPVIGKTNYPGADNLYVAFNAATNQRAADSNVYYATYFMHTYNHGNTWEQPKRITPATPLKDYRYVSMSHTNSQRSSLPGADFFIQMLVQVHDYAGAFAPNMPPGPTDILSMKVEIPITVSDINAKDPDKNSLKQNSPNPFNPATTIRFNLQNESKVTLTVYDSRGQEVATLISNEFLTAGTKEVVFNGSDLASGIYFYTIFAGDFVETKKMLLIK